ncbi:MAG: hypothetical protein ACR2PZ_16005 [Pseudomonadales bacterium]
MSKPKAKNPKVDNVAADSAANAEESVDKAIEQQMSAVDSSAQPAANADRPTDDAAMGQVRDLLFGSVVEQMRAEFQQNARSVLGTVKSLHKEFTERTDELQQQLATLQKDTGKEAEDRKHQHNALSERLTQLNESFTEKLEDQEREMERTASRVGADIKTQNRNQKRAMEELEFKLFGALEDYTNELRDGKLNRDEFATLLSTLAGKVSGEAAANESESEAPSKAANG